LGAGKTQSHDKCLKTRCVPQIGCTLCSAAFYFSPAFVPAHFNRDFEKRKLNSSPCFSIISDIS